jgi:lysophospholipase L1-like esterase
MRAFLLVVALVLTGGGAALTARGEITVQVADLRTTETFDAARGYGFEPDGAPSAAQAGFVISFAVPEGNHRVRVTFGGEAASDTTVRAETRRLVFDSIVVPAGGSLTREFIVNTRHAKLAPPEPNAPGGTEVRLKPREIGSFRWDEKLTLEFTGRAPAVRSITLAPTTAPTVFLFGDSTVADQASGDFASWGQMLTFFVGPGLAIANHAESGETLKSFLTSLRFDKALSLLHAGDWVFIQFGHNDQKANWPQTYAEAGTTFRAYLRTYLAEVRRRGAHPVLLTSPQRRQFDGTKVRNTHRDYPHVVRALAAAEGVPLIDLERASIALYEALGPEKSPLAFANAGRDATHHNAYGAYLLAQAVAEAIRAQSLPLARYLRTDVPAFDPHRPLAPADFPPTLLLK